MNRNKADIYKAIVDASNNNVQHDAFKYIKRWWKNGKWNYEYKSDFKSKSKTKISNLPRDDQHSKEARANKAKADAKKAESTAKRTAQAEAKALREAQRNSKSAMQRNKINPAKNVKTDKSIVVTKNGYKAAKLNLKEAKKKSVVEKLFSKAKDFVSDAVDDTKKAIDKVKDAFINKPPERPADDPLPSLAWKTENTSKAEDVKAVNPNYDPTDLEYSLNCAYCTLAYDLRRRGYDVEAKPNPIGPAGDILTQDVEDMYEGGKMKDLSTLCKENNKDINNLTYDEAAEIIFSDMKKHPDGARGQFCVYWATGGGHSIVWEKEDGGLKFRDTQVNKSLTTKEFVQNYFLRSTYFEYMRTDNLRPSEKCLDYVQNRNKKGSDK